MHRCIGGISDFNLKKNCNILKSESIPLSSPAGPCRTSVALSLSSYGGGEGTVNGSWVADYWPNGLDQGLADHGGL